MKNTEKQLTNANDDMYTTFMANQLFEHRQVIKIFASINGRTLMRWEENELFKAVIPPGGSGNRRRYSYRNVIQIGVIEQLRNLGAVQTLIQGYLDVLASIPVETDVDWVLIGNHPYVLPGKTVGNIQKIRRSTFGDYAARAIFGETGNRRLPCVASAIIVSIFDLAEMVEKFS